MKTQKNNTENIIYFDAHSHLHSDFFNKKENGQEIAVKMAEQGIYSVIIGVDFADSSAAVAMANVNNNLYASIGHHPADNPSEEWDEKKYQKLLDVNREKIVCIGECGLDYYWPSNDLGEGKITQDNFEKDIQRQKKSFETQIDFAVKNNLPLMLHIRSFENADAHRDAFKILDAKQKEHNGKVRANFHFFTESPEIVSEIIKRGFIISLPGVITFANLDEMVRSIPLENIMSETDSPFAAPKPHRGKTNTPLYIGEIVKKIAAVKEISEEQVREQTVKNAINFFNI